MRREVAELAGISLPTIKRLEKRDGVVAGRASTVEAVWGALEKRGAIFIAENGGGPGVRLKKRGRK